MRKTITTISVMALMAAPVAAQAAAAPAPRAAVPMAESEELVGTTAWILAAIGLGLLIWGIIELTDDDEPESP